MVSQEDVTPIGLDGLLHREKKNLFMDWVGVEGICGCGWITVGFRPEFQSLEVIEMNDLVKTLFDSYPKWQRRVVELSKMVCFSQIRL